MSIVIEKSSIKFLKDLSKNNNREWFTSEKDHYLKAQENLIAFTDGLLIEMQKHDNIETPSGKNALHRI